MTSLSALLVVGLSVSYYHLYRANFPDDRGGHGSLIFFKEIQGRAEAEYIAEFTACDEAHLRNDLLGQIWRNSQVLCAKYQGVKKAIAATTVSIIPFLLLVIVTATVHGRMPVFKG